MDFNLLPDSKHSAPVRTDAEGFGDWLTVSEAVVYCSLQELDRTPKTIRKWAHRSHSDPENAELIVRREDVDNGFRWTIERTSLDRKIAQELEFEARRATDPVNTGADGSGEVHTGTTDENEDSQREVLPQPVQTGAHPPEPGLTSNGLIGELRQRIEDLKSEVDFYRDELRDRRQTTTALTDVIEAFRLTARTNANRAERESEQSTNQSRIFQEGDRDPHAGAPDAV